MLDHALEIVGFIQYQVTSIQHQRADKFFNTVNKGPELPQECELKREIRISTPSDGLFSFVVD